MKKTTKWIAVCMAAITGLFAAGCKKDVEEKTKPVSVVKIYMEETLSLAPEATYQLQAWVYPTDADDQTLTYSSSDEAVATVDKDGKITAIKVGKAIITAKAGGKEATCKVTVLDICSHFYSEVDGKCADCYFPKPTMEDGTIDNFGTLTKYAGTATTAVIPHGVTGIGGEAFKDCAKLESVTIPKSVIVQGIAMNAFEGCESLESVIFDGALAQWCQLYCDDDNFAEYVKNVTLVGENNLDLRTAKTLEIPDGVTRIGKYAFWKCAGLESVKIPDSVDYIGAFAFGYCENLKSVEIPANVEYISSGTFGCCTNLESVTIPDGVERISDGAFIFCDNLKSVTIPDSVTEIGASAFRACIGLTSVTIGSGVKTIWREAFKDCTSLKSVTIPNGVTSIGDNAFRGCTRLKKIQFNGTKAQWQAIEGSDTAPAPCIQCSDGYLGVKDVPDYLIMVGTKVTGYADGLPANLVIPDGVTEIEYRAFYGCTSLASVTIPDGVTEIGYSAFEGCTSLASVEIPDSVTSIGGSAFLDCTSLTEMTIPNGVTVIDGYAFYRCNSLKTVSIPGSVKSIGIWGFGECDKLETVNYEGDEEQWRKIEINEYSGLSGKKIIGKDSIEIAQ